MEENENDVGGGRNVAIGERDLANQMLALQSQIASLQRTVEEMRGRLDERTTELGTNIGLLAANVRRLEPRVRHFAAGGRGGGEALAPAAGRGGTLFVASLSPNPRTLYILWDEYMNGVGGRKPAKDFTRQERGRVKFKYHRRRHVWNVVACLVDGGVSADVALDIIYAVYGVGSSVTSIINQMIQDKQLQIHHPTLTV